MVDLLLPNLRSAHNVGSIFRTAEAAGVTKIYLAGYTPAPVDRFGRVNSTITKTALGAEKTLVWEAVPEILPLINNLKAENYKIIALEQAPNSINYRQIELTDKMLVVVGNEVEGVAPEILAECDQIAEIPLRGSKESLNVSVAVGIFLFQILL